MADLENMEKLTAVTSVGAKEKGPLIKYCPPWLALGGVLFTTFSYSFTCISYVIFIYSSKIDTKEVFLSYLFKNWYFLISLT